MFFVRRKVNSEGGGGGVGVMLRWVKIGKWSDTKQADSGPEVAGFQFAGDSCSQACVFIARSLVKPLVFGIQCSWWVIVRPSQSLQNNVNRISVASSSRQHGENIWNKWKQTIPNVELGGAAEILERMSQNAVAHCAVRLFRPCSSAFSILDVEDVMCPSHHCR